MKFPIQVASDAGAGERDIELGGGGPSWNGRDCRLTGRGFGRAVRFLGFFLPSRPEPRWRAEKSAFFRRAPHSAILVAAIFLFMGATDDSARFNSLGHRLMCTCGCGQILLECNHVGCQSSDKMRNELIASLDRGDNDDLILQGFVQNYGPTVVAAPTASGFNRVAWIMPFAVLALGIGLAVHIVRSWKDRPAPALADGIRIPASGELDDLKRQAREETEV